MAHFTENQKIKQWWLWTILFAIVLLFFYAIFQQVILGEPFGNNPIPTAGLIALTLIPIGIMALLYSINLTTLVEDDYIYVSLKPLGEQKILFKDIKSAKIIYYGFVGYGLRFSPNYGTIYNTSGKVGLQIIMKNGNKYLIGTQKDTELEKVIKQRLK